MDLRNCSFEIPSATECRGELKSEAIDDGGKISEFKMGKKKQTCLFVYLSISL